jgi:hypothetical protein
VKRLLIGVLALSCSSNLQPSPVSSLICVQISGSNQRCSDSVGGTVRLDVHPGLLNGKLENLGLSAQTVTLKATGHCKVATNIYDVPGDTTSVFGLTCSSEFPAMTTLEAFTAGWVQVYQLVALPPAEPIDSGVTLPLCRVFSLRGDRITLGNVDVGSTSSDELMVVLDGNVGCEFDVELEPNIADVAVQPSVVIFDRPLTENFLVKVLFNPSSHDIEYSGKLRVFARRSVAVQDRSIEVPVSARSPPRCPQLGSGCPVGEPGLFALAASKVYRLDMDGGPALQGGVEVRDVSTGLLVPLSDIAVLPGGRMLGSTESSLYVVDEVSGLARKILPLPGSSVGLAATDVDELLVGTRNEGVFHLSLLTGTTTLLFSAPVAGDIAVWSNNVYVTTEGQGGVSNLLLYGFDGGSVELGSTGVVGMYGIEWADSGLVGASRGGGVYRISAGDGSVQAVGSFPLAFDGLAGRK